MSAKRHGTQNPRAIASLAFARAARGLLVQGDMPAVRVKHIMTTRVCTLFEETSLPLTEEIMENKRFRHIPVVGTDGRLVGLVTQSDIFQAQISNLVGMTPLERRVRQDEVEIRQIMTRTVLTVTPETLASEAGRLLLEHRIGCLPVVDEFELLRGIITERDFLRFAVKAIAMHDDEVDDDAPEVVESRDALTVVERVS